MIIYLVKNKINGKIYIGKTIQPINNRKAGHYNLARNGSETNFHRALRKYDRVNFDWNVIVECKSKTELDKMEINMINEYNSYKNGYNMTLGGDGGLTYKRGDVLYKRIKDAGKLGRRKDGTSYSDNNPGATKSAIEKRIKTFSKKDDWISGKEHPNYGKIHSVETLEKLRGENNPMYGKHPYLQSVKIDGIVYESLGDASRQLGYTRSTIRNRCENKNYKTWEKLNVTRQTKF